MHLAMARKILDIKNIKNSDYVNRFLIGNIVPDVIRGSAKRHSHFWSEEMYQRFDRKPVLDMFLNKYSHRLGEPYVFGYYAHLYLDAMYMERYWDKHFSYYDANMQPINGFDNVKKIKVCKDNNDMSDGVVYDRDSFLSDRYYYGDYDRMSSYYIEKYELLLPEINDRVAESITDIDEISVKEYKSRLISMIERIKNMEVYYKKDKSDFLNYEGKTKILDIKEIDKLVEAAAKELSMMC